MTDIEKIKDLKATVEELEALAVIEREESASGILKIKSEHDLKVEKLKLVHNSDMHALNSKYSALNRKHNLLLKRHQLIFDAFKEVTNVSDDDSDLEQIDEATKCLTQTVIKTLSSQTKQLDIAYKSIEKTDQALETTISSQRKEIKRLVTEVKNLKMKDEVASTTIRELKFTICQSDKSWEEKMLSHDKEMVESVDRLKSQYAFAKEDYERKINGLQLKNEEAKKEIEKMKSLYELGEEMLLYLRPNSMGEGTRGSPPSFIPVQIGEGLIKKLIPHERKSFYRFGLGISRYDILAVSENFNSFGLYSEDSKEGEEIFTPEEQAYCIAWNHGGTLLALGGRNKDHINGCIQIWDIPKRKLVRRLKIADFQTCRCLDWNENIIVAGTDSFIYQWDVNKLDEDAGGRKNLITSAIITVTNMHVGFISAIQWSPCKLKFAAITNKGRLSIFDHESRCIDHIKAHDDGQYEKIVQWCPWDSNVVATSCWRGFLRIWNVEKNIKLVKEINLLSGIANLKWIPGEKAIVTAHKNKALLLLEFPTLNVIKTMGGHTEIPFYLALNGDQSAIVSKSDKEIIFWKPFHEF